MAQRDCDEQWGQLNPMSEVEAQAFCCELYDRDEFVGLGAEDAEGRLMLRAGGKPPGAEVVPVRPPSGRIAVVCGAQDAAARQLAALYPGRVEVREPGGSLAEALREAQFAVISCDDEQQRPRVPWGELHDFAQRGGTVIASLDDYATARDLTCLRRMSNRRHFLQVEVEHDLFGGCAVGDRIPWHGRGENRPIFQQLSFRCLADFAPDGNRRTLAMSSVTGLPVAVEERVGSGRVIALDLLAVNRDAGGTFGSKNKWVLPGNILGGSVRYSRWWPAQLEYDTQYVELLAELAARFEGALSVEQAGDDAAGNPIHLMRLGAAGRPVFMLVAVLHGWEVMNAHGLLRLVEFMLESRESDRKIRWLLDNFGLCVLPIMNPWGYKLSIQTNANDCDLNRNYPVCWEEYDGDGGWRADYSAEQLRGRAPFSEPEARIIRDLVEGEQVIGLIDFHQHGWQSGHTFMYPEDASGRRSEQILFAHALASARLSNRFLCDSETQMELKLSTNVSRKPFLRRWADSVGIPAITQETVGGFEDSFSNGEVVAEVALAFCQCLGLAYLTEQQG